MSVDEAIPTRALLRGESSSRDDEFWANMEHAEETNDEYPSRSKSAGGKADGGFWSKVWLLAILLGTAAGLTIVLSKLSDKQERHDNEEWFQELAEHALDLSSQRIGQNMRAFRGLSTTLTSLAINEGSPFPFFTVSHFEAQIEEALTLSRSDMVAFAPILLEEDIEEWESYSASHSFWIEAGLDYRGLNLPVSAIPDAIHNLDGSHASSDDASLYFSGKRVPIWEVGPVPFDTSIVNLDLLSTSLSGSLYSASEARQSLVSTILDTNFLRTQTNSTTEVHHARSVVVQPVAEAFDVEAPIVGYVVAIMPWEQFFSGMFPFDIKGIIVVLEDTCSGTFSFEVNGSKVEYLGEGDLHDSVYDSSSVSRMLTTHLPLDNTLKAHSDLPQCDYIVSLYMSSRLETHQTSDNTVYITAVLGMFLVTAIVFISYDCLMSRSQRRTLVAAEKSRALVASLFPKSIQDRIFQEAVAPNEESSQPGRGNKTRLKSFLHGNELDQMYENKPIADLFAGATVMFADIVGFTAWSSMREPSQVFTLLEAIFAAFDEIAERRNVFKVETVGDCYVAVVGVPDPRPDHAPTMARFAHECLSTFSDVVRKLEVVLGPDTGDLGMRVGLHSGPVTAGVLRGQKARFQLFGDTMNTASRIESTGARDRIHVSHETAELLIDAHKSHWLEARSEKVVAKGKGEMQTYWLDLTTRRGRESCADSVSEMRSLFDDGTEIESILPEASLRYTDKEQRLIDWNTALLSQLLKLVIARRRFVGSQPSTPAEIRAAEQVSFTDCAERCPLLDDVKDIIHLPQKAFDAHKVDLESIHLSDDVASQLRDFVQSIAAMYRENPFHNFEHAAHVTMSVVKLLSRIRAPDFESSDSDADLSQMLHDHTYGINSDPLTQFAVVLSALIHDLDHPGVPNSTLVKEGDPLAGAYKNKSVAEQNSIDLAWRLLMHDRYIDLREALYINVSQVKRFRQLVVNSVMATDIMDTDLKNLRNDRWEIAFSEQSASSEDSIHHVVNRKATIVIEHLMQASDVAHTMQHWQIYQKWNERLFAEMYQAYKDGRADKDPSEFWFKGELGFFDFYIIPLAKKLKDCGVFGVSSDEYLNYATQNRKEWEDRGREVVARYVQKYEKTRLGKFEPSEEH